MDMSKFAQGEAARRENVRRVLAAFRDAVPGMQRTALLDRADTPREARSS